MKNAIHITLQSKGGVGKSFITTILAQYLKDYKGLKISGADTDPANRSFQSIKALNVRGVDIMENNVVLQSKFDSIFELMATDEKSNFIIDNGSSSFFPLIKYIQDNDIINLFEELDKPIYFHTVITGGQSQADTLQGMAELYKVIMKSSKKIKMVIWLNEFQGQILGADNYFKSVSDKTAGFIEIKNRNSDAYNSDLEKLTKLRLTLKEALDNPEFNLMSKNRLKRFYNDIYTQLDEYLYPPVKAKELNSNDN